MCSERILCTQRKLISKNQKVETRQFADVNINILTCFFLRCFVKGSFQLAGDWLGKSGSTTKHQTQGKKRKDRILTDTYRGNNKAFKSSIPSARLSFSLVPVLVSCLKSSASLPLAIPTPNSGVLVSVFFFDEGRGGKPKNI